ncbi:MAG: hypothetical protein DRI30_00595 [Chloroflexi bacterium]|nr:MAG: hypothetical protein DRI30_00595 [Chloroflexota bacterium]
MSNIQTSKSEPSNIVQTPAGHEAPIGFFAIGLVINLALIAAYLIWAIKQWKKSSARDKS